MSVRQISNGNWQAMIRKKGFPTQSKVFRRKIDAQMWETEVLSGMNKGVFVSAKEAERTTLKELLERYLEECVPALSDPKREGNRVKKLMARPLALRIVATIRSTDIADFVKERQAEGVSGNTVRLDVAVLSKLFNLARSEWGFESLGNPVENVRRPKVNKGRERRLEEGEEDALLAAASDKLRPCISFALETAMRREEIASLTWENVDLGKRQAVLPKTKNGDRRTVLLSSRALEILKGLGAKGEGLVFGISADAITQAMEAARKKAGIEDLHFHDLRHEATSRLFENTDLDVMEIRSITGHRSLQMLARYSHLRSGRLAERLDGAARGRTEGR